MSTELITPIDISKLNSELAAKHEALAEQHRAFLEQRDRESADRREEFERQQAEYERRRAESDERFDRRMEESRLEHNRQTEEYNRKFAQLVEQTKETDRIVKANSHDIGKLGNRIGDIVENMVGGNIVAQFQKYAYSVTELSRDIKFGIKGTATAGQIDVLLDDGDVAILIEVKTRPSTDDVRDHVERLKDYRRWKDSKGEGKKRYIGAIAGAVVDDNVAKFAQKHGMFVIVQSGYAVEIVAPPEGFKAKEW
jgi:hypothetical protein